MTWHQLKIKKFKIDLQDPNLLRFVLYKEGKNNIDITILELIYMAYLSHADKASEYII